MHYNYQRTTHQNIFTHLRSYRVPEYLSQLLVEREASAPSQPAEISHFNMTYVRRRRWETIPIHLDSWFSKDQVVA